MGEGLQVAIVSAVAALAFAALIRSYFKRPAGDRRPAPGGASCAKCDVSSAGNVHAPRGVAVAGTSNPRTDAGH
jgi:hypothetical protein